MKKIALLLSFMMLLSILTSCHNEDETSGVSGDISEELSSDGVQPISHSTIVSVGKSYTVSKAADDAYEDSYTTELTDGIFVDADAPTYGDDKLSGYGENTNIIIDLGDDSNRLYQFEVSYLSTTTAGIAPISNCKITIADTNDENTEWTSLGTVKKPTYIENSMQVAKLTLETPINARYVKFQIMKASAWVFLDELTVISDSQGTSASLEYLKLLDEAYANDSLTNDERLAALNSVLGDDIDRSKTAVLYSQGCSYSSSYSAATTNFTNDGKKLTNGNDVGSSYESEAWVGYEGGEQLDLTVTLKQERSDLADFSLSMFNRPTTGITLPAYVDISVSSDNETFTLIGRVYASSDAAQSNYTYSLKLQQGVKGKYVRFTLAKTDCSLFLVEETAVYVYTDEVILTGDPLYPDVVIPQVSEPTYWPSSTTDYKKNINLISNMSYQIASGVLLYKAEEASFNSPVTSTILTDGIKSNDTNYSSSTWFKTHLGFSRNIYFDLVNNSTITGFSINFLQYSSVGIGQPGLITLYLSDDGISWYGVNSTIVPQASADPAITAVKVTLDKAVQARFARFSYDVGCHVYLDEIQLFGTKYVASGTPACDELGIKDEESGNMLAPSEDVLGGASDVMLAYHTSNVLTKDVFLSYVAYLDSEKNIKDTMFDGYLFLPSVAALPSGGLPYKNSIKSDWDYVLESVFAEGVNLDALNQAVTEVKTALSIPDYKVKVYYTLLYPSLTVTDFGDVDGDGVSEDFSKLDDRLKAEEWYMKEFLKRFDAAAYENLEFCGFYWFHETVNTAEDDMNTLNGVSNLVHEQDSQFFWIPYFSALGYNQWTAYGFDAVCLQPNYVFNDDANESRIAETAHLIKLFNLCIEIEFNNEAFDNEIYYDRYMDYLKGGIYYGYMTGSIHMYYQGTTDIYKASISEDVKTRTIYDYTYQFIKGTLDIYPDKLDDFSITAQAGTIYQDILFAESELTKATISVSAKNGTVTINKNGSYRYYPNKGFTGTDSFTFRISNGLDWSEETTVTINVQ